MQYRGILLSVIGGAAVSRVRQWTGKDRVRVGGSAMSRRDEHRCGNNDAMTFVLMLYSDAVFSVTIAASVAVRYDYQQNNK